MGDNRKISVLIADDHALFRSGIISILKNTQEIEIADEAANGEELIEKYIMLKPDVIIADISMPRLSGTEAVRRLIESGQQPKVLFLSMYTGDEYKYYCSKVGGGGLISKDVLEPDLLFAIKTVYSGRKYFGAGWNDDKQNELAKKFEGNIRINSPEISVSSLTKREKEILILISEGYTSNQIAEKLFLGKRTIDSYRCNLLKKLELHSLPELISYAVKNTPDLLI